MKIDRGLAVPPWPCGDQFPIHLPPVTRAAFSDRCHVLHFTGSGKWWFYAAVSLPGVYCLEFFCEGKLSPDNNLVIQNRAHRAKMFNSSQFLKSIFRTTNWWLQKKVMWIFILELFWAHGYIYIFIYIWIYMMCFDIFDVPIILGPTGAPLGSLSVSCLLSRPTVVSTWQFPCFLMQVTQHSSCTPLALDLQSTFSSCLVGSFW